MLLSWQLTTISLVLMAVFMVIQTRVGARRKRLQKRTQVVEQGTHAELLAPGGLYARLYEEQFGAGTVEARLDHAVEFTDGSLLIRRAGPPKADVSL